MLQDAGWELQRLVHFHLRCYQQELKSYPSFQTLLLSAPCELREAAAPSFLRVVEVKCPMQQHFRKEKMHVITTMKFYLSI